MRCAQTLPQPTTATRALGRRFSQPTLQFLSHKPRQSPRKALPSPAVYRSAWAARAGEGDKIFNSRYGGKSIFLLLFTIFSFDEKASWRKKASYHTKATMVYSCPNWVSCSIRWLAEAVLRSLCHPQPLTWSRNGALQRNLVFCTGAITHTSVQKLEGTFLFLFPRCDGLCILSLLKKSNDTFLWTSGYDSSSDNSLWRLVLQRKTYHLQR